MKDYSLFCGDCLDVLATMEENSVDSVVTDPPAGVSIMGKKWDSDKGGRDKWISWMTDVAKECLRVAKPGAHAFVWALPRTSHWTATAWENAGWECKDKVYYLHSTGFPKNHNIGKKIDEKAGAVREVLGSYERSGVSGSMLGRKTRIIKYITEPATEEAKQWDGWGTAVKPAAEEWLLLRKPLAEKTIAENVLAWGTGALNIDGCRVPRNEKEVGESIKSAESKGRWPSTVILDGSNEVLSGLPVTRDGSAARYFYHAKPNKKDKGEGNNHPTTKSVELMQFLTRLITPSRGIVLDCFMGSGSTGISAMIEGFRFIGIEQDSDYVAISEKRISFSLEQKRDGG